MTKTMKMMKTTTGVNAGAKRSGLVALPPSDSGREHTPPLVRRRVAEQLLELRDSTGRGLSKADYGRFSETTGRSVRQIRRWVNDEAERRAHEALVNGTASDRAAKAAAQRVVRGQRARFELSDDMLTVLAAAPNVYEAWLFLRFGDPNSVVAKDEVSKSTFYEAVNRLPAAIRVGLTQGGEAIRDVSPHLPRSITRFGESYSYDLKNLRVACVHDTGEVHSDNWLLSFRDEASNLVVGRWVIDFTPTDAEVAACFAETVRGWTLDGTTIKGAPLLLRTDNGSNLNGSQMRRAQALVGSLITPSESYESAGNGRHERYHLDVDRDLRSVPGYTRSPLKRGAKPYVQWAAADLLTFDQLVAYVYDLIDNFNFEHRPATDRHRGRTPFEMATDLLAAGEQDLTDVPDELLAPLGLPLPERLYNLNEGTLQWDNELYHHSDLADLGGNRRYRATRLPNDPSIVFVINEAGHYVTTAVRLRDLPDGLRNRTIRERKEREHLVDRHQQAAAHRLGRATWTSAFAPGAPEPESDASTEATIAEEAAVDTVLVPVPAVVVDADITAPVAAEPSAGEVAGLLAARGVTA